LTRRRSAITRQITIFTFNFFFSMRKYAKANKK